MLEVKNIHKRFGDNEVLKGVDFKVEKGSVIAVLGNSGSGKTTLLRCISFLERADQGEIQFDDFRKDITAVSKPEIRALRMKMGFVFQGYNLFRNMTALQNVMEGLTTARKIPEAEAKKRAREVLDKVGMSDRENFYPDQLSGGQQQRVGVARALAADPQVLLMDEPFGALDPVTRGALQQEMTRIHRLLGRTIVLVTHDIDEALRLAEHLVLMDHGEVVQQGNPLTMLTRPANDFVRQFFGRSELGVRLLSLRSVADYVRREERADGEALAEEMTLRDALSLFVARGCEVLPVVNTQGQPCGTLHFQDLLVEA